MGAEFIFSVISTLSSLLSSVRSSGATLADGEGGGIERGLDRLERLLRRIQATLRGAGEREIQDEYEKHWLKELKTLAYEAEDILDEWQYEILHRRIEESGEEKSSSTDGKKRKRLDGVVSDEMAERIKRVIELFDEISRDKDALFLKEDDGERRSVWTSLSPSSHLVNKSAIFGRDQDKQKILDFVLSDSRWRTDPISAIAILGMGGVGKTTLAQLVYNDSVVQHHFQISAWVYVSPEFDVLRITKEILESINPQQAYCGLTGLSAAQQTLVNVIRGKKFLVVLDDVWNQAPRKWEQFLEPLRAAKFVKIVMTTRNDAVYQISGTTNAHKLSCLSEIQSHLLFEQYVYGGQSIDEFSYLKDIGVQIVKKCAGLPLAIKSIGRVLSYKMDKDSWTDILKSELWKSDGKDEIFPALKVSYYKLPLELKPCFLFCSLFPKGSLLEMNGIIYMWIAHGYIRPCGSRKAEDIGNEFIHELCRRSFLTRKETPEIRGLEYFMMHDLIHDLARSISTGEFYTNHCENINDAYTEVYHAYTEHYGMISRLSQRPLSMRTLLSEFVMDKLMFDLMHSDGWILQDEFMKNIEHRANYPNGRLGYADTDDHIEDLIRSPFFSMRKNEHLQYITGHSDLERLMGCYNSMILGNINLRVLKWEGARAHDLENVDNLKHLRYLELNNKVQEHLEVDCGKLERLPESVTRLFNLVALQLSFLKDLTELPINFGKLINLRFFGAHVLGIRDLPESLGELSNLQCLSVVGCTFLQKLPTTIGNLTNLKKLYLSGLIIRELPLSFCMLQSLQTLSINGCSEMTQLPDGIGNLTNLQWIYSRASTFETMPESMNSLCNLKILELGCSGSPVAFLQGYEGLLYRSSLNFSIERSDGRKQERYVKTQRFIDSLQPVSDLVRLKIDEYQEIGYASWFSDSRFSSAAIAMHCHVKSGNFITKLEELPSLKLLSLIRITSIQNLRFNTPQTSIPHESKVQFPCLTELEFVDISEWNLTDGEYDGDFPLLESLKIENCPKLSSVPNFGNIRMLEIIRCSFSKLELDLLHLQLLEGLYIEECLQLTLLLGLQNLSFIRALCILRCPLLEEFLYPVKPKLPLSIEIVECPSLKCWCQKNQLNYIKDFSCKTLVTSANWNIVKEWNQNFLVEHLVIRNCIKQSLKLDGRLCNLTSVEVRDCWKLEIFEGLHILRFLRKLVLWDCPQLQLRKPGDESEIPLPPSLQSLAIHGCHNILSLNLLTQDRSSFTELEVIDCKRLMRIVGLHELTKLETLAIMQCPQLLLEPLHNVPDCVVISGCPRLKAWCEMHSVEPLDDEID